MTDNEYDSIRRKLQINILLEYNTIVTDYLIRGMLYRELKNFDVKNIQIIELSREVVKGDGDK